MSQVFKKLIHLQIRIFCENIQFAERLVALYFPTRELRTKEYQRIIPQVSAKGDKENAAYCQQA